MAVQHYATRRNQQAELLVQFVIRSLAERLATSGALASEAIYASQKTFNRDDCSDVFDHYLELPLTGRIGELRGTLQLWVQTTCYKGSSTNAPEPNKTYEVRETLIEALGLRQWLIAEGQQFRTLHFTVGPADYTYGWFRPAKDASFDLSLYPPEGTRIESVFDQLESVLANARTVDDQLAALKAVPAGSQVGRLISYWSHLLYRWFSAGAHTNAIADMQAILLRNIRLSQGTHLVTAAKAAQLGGADIIGRAVALLEGGSSDDLILVSVVRQLVSDNPFLETSLQAESAWTDWTRLHFAIPRRSTGFASYVRHLWTLPPPDRLLARRLLARIHDATAHYVADLGIQGLTEHNLYAGHHSDRQVQLVVETVTRNCAAHGITTASQLHNRLCGPFGRSLSAACRRSEARNGTAMKPSFLYVVESLRPKYIACSIRDAALASPVGYQSQFGDARVDPYSNLVVLQSAATGHPVGILKAKYFRPQEFPRRAKEEAYVALTARHTFDGTQFRERYVDLPWIMFVDMPLAFVPPSYAVARLVTAGWQVVFTINGLRQLIIRS